MLRLVTLGALILAVSAGAPKCCGPDQVIAGVGATNGLELGGQPAAYITYAYGAFDFRNGDYGYYLNLDSSQSSQSMRIIQNYTEQVQWVIQYEGKTEKCTKQPITQPAPNNCIPDDAEFKAQMTFGGKNGLVADSYSYGIHYPHVPQDARAYATVVHENCYPLTVALVGEVFVPDINSTIPFISTSGVVNMTVGIPNPDAWFTLPDSCRRGNSVSPRFSRALPDFDLKAFHLPTFF
nr:development-specific protein LVN1.2-like [Lytechinus pictus]